MRDWSRIDQYVSRLYGDIYPQPEDAGHTQYAERVVDYWMSRMSTCKSVLDVGCGTGFCQPLFEKWMVSYEGICLGEDFLEAQRLGRNVKKMDFSFLEYEDRSFDLVFSRHSLEHSPMPLLTLLEWHRVSKSWLGIVLPSPDWFTYTGRNHYHVMNWEQIHNLLDVAGWNILWEKAEQNVWDEKTGELKDYEYWIMCEKKR